MRTLCKEYNESIKELSKEMEQLVYIRDLILTLTSVAHEPEAELSEEES